MKNLTREQYTAAEHAIRQLSTDDQLALASFALRCVWERLRLRTCPGCVRIREAAGLFYERVAAALAECRENAATNKNTGHEAMNG